MCCSGYCTRSCLFVLSLFFLLVGGGLTGVAIYALVYELLFNQHFLDAHLKDLDSAGFSPERKKRITDYFLVVASVAIGLGFTVFLAGIAGLMGACKNFRVINQYGVRRSSLGCFVFFLIIILGVTGLVAALSLFIGADGRKESSTVTVTVEATKSPDYELNWKPKFSVQQFADQVYQDLTDFVLKTCDDVKNEKDAGAMVRNALYLIGGVFCAIVALTVFWMIVACCVSCRVVPGDAEYLYVSPERKRYDDWVRS